MRPGSSGQVPACPEDHQHDFSFFLSEVKCLAVEARSLDGGGRLAHQLDPLRRLARKSLTAGLGLVKDEPESLASDRELVRFDQSPIVGLANSDQLCGGQGGPISRCRFFLVLSAICPAEALQRLFRGPAVDFGNDLDQMGQRIGRGRRRTLLDHLDGGRFGVAEQVAGNRKAEEPLVSRRGHGVFLPCGQKAKPFQPPQFQQEELPVVSVVDRLDTRFGPGPGPGRTVPCCACGLALS